MWKFFSPRYWLALFEKLLIASEDKPILRALVIPIIATHIIPLPVPASFIIFIAFPAGIVAYLNKFALHSSEPLLMILAFIVVDLVIYGIAVLVCIPLTPLILKNALKFTRYVDGALEKLGQFSKDMLAKMNGKDK